tara:strand:+ start:44 stop:559 length:516 start_codon:yes stop_codon:yes gene_type:complete
MKKLFLTFTLFGCILGQELPQPALIGVDLKKPTLKISKIVVDKNTGIVDKRITMGLPELLEEAFQNSKYVLVDSDNADFVASSELIWYGRPDEAFSIIGLFNRRKSETEIRLNVIITEVATQKKIVSRGIGTIQTDIASAGLQIEENIPFNRSELGGAVRKAIDEATKQLK